MSGRDPIEDVNRLEDARHRALIEGDDAALEALLDDSLIYTHSNGLVDTKAGFLDGFRNRTYSYQSIERDAVQSRLHGTTVYMAGEARMCIVSNGATTNLRLRYSDVWISTPDGWKFALWHSSAVPVSGGSK